MRLPAIVITLLITCLCTKLYTQNLIHFSNPSFEGDPSDATVPVGWLPCEVETTPDILPGFWGVYREASDGDTFLGLITRSNNTWESITQRLSGPLLKDNCYRFTLDLARSATYNQYNQPIKLRVWGSRTKCEKRQLLLETDFIQHSFWKSYEVSFYAETQLNYIILEAFYTEEHFEHSGNVLIDNLSPIKQCPRA